MLLGSGFCFFEVIMIRVLVRLFIGYRISGSFGFVDIYVF